MNLLPTEKERGNSMEGKENTGSKCRGAMPNTCILGIPREEEKENKEEILKGIVAKHFLDSQRTTSQINNKQKLKILHTQITKDQRLKKNLKEAKELEAKEEINTRHTTDLCQNLCKLSDNNVTTL